MHFGVYITLQLCVNLPAKMEEPAPFLDSVHVQLSGKETDVNMVNPLRVASAVTSSSTLLT